MEIGVKKKFQSRYGPITISLNHTWSNSLFDIQISPYLQELYVYGGQSDNYEKSCKWLSKCLQINIGSSPMDRLSQLYGSLMSFDKGSEEATEQIQTFADSLLVDETVYAMVDGSMIPTREGEQSNDWKEVKLGRIFGSSSIETVDKHHNKIKQSAYIAELGNSTTFCQKMASALCLAVGMGREIVFINDGSQWIWNWITDTYPNSIRILDYYHAIEKLSACSKLLYTDPQQAKDWLAQQQEHLLCDDVGKLLEELEKLLGIVHQIEETAEDMLTTSTAVSAQSTQSTSTAVSAQISLNTTKKAEVRLIYNYIKKHEKRMLYKTFRDNGYLVGSGPIESAHRVVLQKRLKQSGQRWTKEGAQNIINLRVTFENNQWNRIIDLIKRNEKKTHKQTA